MKAVLFLAALALFMATFVKATTDDECLGCADKIKTAVEYCDVSRTLVIFYKNNFHKNIGSNSQKVRLKIKNTVHNVLRLNRFGVSLFKNH